jgi:pimeloyl-ACP methyl ester carboxylesterase
MPAPASTAWTLPAWVDGAAYPFAPRAFAAPAGTLRYVDVGSGPAVVLVHGTPTWSFLYRALIVRLAERHRVIAVDHLGFGLSDKPADAPYRPEDHARRLEALLDALALESVALVVHDFGGPIGLAYAVRHPERVRRLVLFNTWLWSLADDPRVARASRLASGPVGRLLYRRLNASPRWLIPMVMGDRRRLSPVAHAHYQRPFPDPASREAPLALARALAGSSAWYDGLWAARARLRAIPTLLLWGMRDPTFGPESLARWRSALPDAEVAEFAGSGHFVLEEEPEASVERAAAFLAE